MCHLNHESQTLAFQDPQFIPKLFSIIFFIIYFGPFRYFEVVPVLLFVLVNIGTFLTRDEYKQPNTASHDSVIRNPSDIIDT